MAQSAHNDKLVGLAFMAIVILLGVNYVAVKFSNMELPPFWGAALRFTVAALVLLLAAKLRKIPLPKGESLKGAVFFGVCAFGVTYGLLYWALLGLSAGVTSVIFATIPLLTLILATVVGLERITPSAVGAAVLVIVGVGIVFQEQAAFNVPWIYLALAFGSALSAALSGVVVKYFPKSHPVATNMVAMSVGAVLLFAASLVTGESIKLPSLGTTWIALSWLITSTIIAFVLMVWVLSRRAASTTSYALVLAPLVTIVAASLLISEPITTDFLIGGAIVLIGVYIGVKAQSQKAIADTR